MGMAETSRTTSKKIMPAPSGNPKWQASIMNQRARAWQASMPAESKAAKENRYEAPMSLNLRDSCEAKSAIPFSRRDENRRLLQSTSSSFRKIIHRNSKLARSTTPTSKSAASVSSFGIGTKIVARPKATTSQSASRKRSITIDGSTDVNREDSHRETRNARTSSPKRNGT